MLPLHLKVMLGNILSSERGATSWFWVSIARACMSFALGSPWTQLLLQWTEERKHFIPLKPLLDTH